MDFVAINNEGRLYVQVTDTLKGIDENDTKILDRELKKMKQQGMSIETIQEITNLDFEEIEKL